MENFRDELEKLAEIVEICEKSFLNGKNIKINSEVDEQTFNKIVSFLGSRDIKDECIIDIGTVEFTFLKK
jgi:hypothetical protein